MSAPQRLEFKQPKQTTLIEHYNQDELNQLLARPDIIEALQRKKATNVEVAFGADRRSIDASLQAYHRKGKNGKLEANYKYAKQQKGGRLYVGGVGMQNMRGLVRQMLVPEGTRDYDFANCAPTCLAHLCKLMDHPCPILDGYNQDREGHWSKLPTMYDTPKQVVISIMYSAPVPLEAHRTWLKAFHKECVSIRNKVCEYFPEVYKKCSRKKNPKASAMSMVLCEIENMCLGTVREYAAKEKLTVRSLIFDGLHMKGEMDCEAASAYVRAKTGVPLKVCEKPIVRRTVQEMALILGLPATLVRASQPPEDVTEVYLPDDMLLDIDGKWNTVEAGMKMGKTEQTMKLVKQYVQRGKRVLFITQRISMASAIFQRLLMEGLTVLEDGETVPLFKDYNDLKGPITANHMICEYESIHRLTCHYDLVVMDEFRSLIETIQGTTNGLKTLLHWDKLKNLTLQSEKNLFLCADMSFDGAAEDVLHMLIKHEASLKCAALKKEARNIMPINREQQTQKDALYLEACKLEEELPDVHRIVSKVQKMKRCNIITDICSAMSRASSLLREGKRIAICCGSIKEANRCAAFLSGVIPHEKIGLYTGLTDNKQDVKELEKCWDKFDCIIFTSTITTGADYNTPVDSTFLIPSVNTCTPRDMCQMAGRLRKLTSGNIYVIVPPAVPYQACTSEDISNAFKAELQRLESCTVTLGKVLHDTSLELRHTLTPDVLARSYTETPHDLLIIGAYSTAEKSFCRGMDEWMSVYLYMSEKKGYTMKSCDWCISEEEQEEIEEFFKQHRRDTAEVEKRLMAKMDVGLFRDDHAAFRHLTTLAKGQNLTREHAAELYQKCDTWGCTLPDPHTERPQLKLFMDKSRVARMFNTKQLSSIDRKFVKKVMKMSTALRLHDMHEHFNADSARLTDFLLTMQSHDVPELRQPHLVPVYMHINELLQAMGYTGLGDRETVPTSSAYHEERVATALRQLVALGVAVRTPGKSDTDMVRTVLRNQVELQYDEGSPLSVTNSLEELMAEKPPCSTEWFEEKWDRPLPEKGQFNPVVYETEDALAAVQEQYEGFRGEVFDRLRVELGARRTEMRARRGDVQREQSKKRRAYAEADWESYQKRARIAAPRLQRPRPRTTKRRRIVSITVVSYNSPPLSTAHKE
jgi:Origin of replication binding protein